MNTLRADDEAGVVGSKPITAEIFHESVENPGTHLNQLKTQAHTNTVEHRAAWWPPCTSLDWSLFDRRFYKICFFKSVSKQKVNDHILFHQEYISFMGLYAEMMRF